MPNLSTRAASFKRDALAWLVVHHFLPAPLVLELMDAIITEWGGGKFSLEELAQFDLSEGEPVLASLGFRPLEQSELLARRLQQLLQLVVWQGDQTMLLGSAQDQEHVDQLRLLDAALQLGHRDLARISDWAAQYKEVAGLAPLVDAMQTLSENIDRRALDVDAIEAALGPHESSPILPVLLKHLGDLAGDLDRWEIAEPLFRRAREVIEQTEPDWNDFYESFATILAQSHAAAVRVTKGPAAAAAMLDELVKGGHKKGPLPMLNAGFDRLGAHIAADNMSALGIERGSVMLAPQLIAAHQAGNALGNAFDGRHNDAHRWFWAVLRRQVALGSAVISRDTKASFAHSLIDQLMDGLGKTHNPDDFLLAIKLLLESGRKRGADAIRWTDRFIEYYVNSETIDAAEAHAIAHAGAVEERSSVLITLANGWLAKLAPDRVDLAGKLMELLAKFAVRIEVKRQLGVDMRRAATKALESAGRDRPEFRASSAELVAEAAIAQLTHSGWMAISDALDAASPYIDEISPQTLETLVGHVLGQIEDRDNEESPLLRSALNLLSHDRILGLAKDRDNEIGRRVARTMVRRTLEAGAEHRRLMYLLRTFDAQVIDDAIDRDRLAGVVSELIENAQRTNASGATDSILALLVAPAISGALGVFAAIDALGNLLNAAVTQRYSMAAADAYDPVIHLAGHYREIAKATGITPEALIVRIGALTEPIARLWEKGLQTPAIFNGFQLPPPTEPNRIIVHNWAFASLALADVTGQPDTLKVALEKAEKDDRLSGAIGTARAVRGRVDGSAFDLTAITKQPRDAFYASLGERIVLLPGLDLEQRAVALRALIERALLLGPSGLDAGLFTAAIQHAVKVERSLWSDGYRARVRADSHLRHAMIPLLERVIEPGDDTDLDEGDEV